MPDRSQARRTRSSSQHDVVDHAPVSLAALPAPTRATSRRLSNPREVRFSPEDDAWLVATAKADSKVADSSIVVADVVRAAVSYYRQVREQLASKTD